MYTFYSDYQTVKYPFSLFQYAYYVYELNGYNILNMYKAVMWFQDKTNLNKCFFLIDH